MNFKPWPENVLVINCGSSSLRSAIYSSAFPPQLLVEKKVEYLGNTGFTAALQQLFTWFDTQAQFASITAIGHRLVHGMHYNAAQIITPVLMDELHQIAQLAPEHLPNALAAISAMQQRFPGLKQIACFDTAFHNEMPRVASQLPIPRHYEKQGVRRYGFHGLSYEFLMQELVRLKDPAANKGRVILAHLGNGCSMVAVRDGKSIDTSMGFTPTGGMSMATRSGDLDPGVAAFIARNDKLTVEQTYHLLHEASGLLGVSETSSDLRDLLTQENNDVRAAEAVALFCYQAKKWIGAFAATLGGLDTLVFSGGIGENAATIRERICADLEFLGIAIDSECNQQHAAVISKDTASVTIRVIATNEESIIARSVIRVLNANAVEKD